MNVLYFGSNALSLRALNILKQSQSKLDRIRQLKVVTPPDRAAGRGQNKLTPCVLKTGARQLGLEVVDGPQDSPRPKDEAWNSIIETSRNGGFDIAVVFSFGYFLPKVLLDAFPLGAINIHPSMLPKYRGASPIQHALLNGDKETGVCIIEIHPEKFDAGRILAKRVISLDRTATYTPVSKHLADIGGEMVIDVLGNIQGCRQNAEQQVGAVSRAPKIDSKLKQVDDWLQPEAIYNKYRAFEHVTCHLKAQQPKKVTLFELSPPQSLPDAPEAKVGDAMMSRDRSKLFIKCGTPQDHLWLPVGKLRLEGKHIVSPNEFNNGYLLRKVKAQHGVITDAFF